MDPSDYKKTTKKKKKWVLARFFKSSQELNEKIDSVDDLSRQHRNSVINAVRKTYTFDQKIFIRENEEEKIEISHQKPMLAERDVDEFEFKGTIVLANRHGEIIDSFDIFPDTSSLTEHDGEKFISQSINDINAIIKLAKEENATHASNVIFHYYVRWMDESRFDCLLSVDMSAKKMAQEFKEILQDKVDMKKGKLQTIHYYNNQEITAVLSMSEDESNNETLLFTIESLSIKIPTAELKSNVPQVSYPYLNSKFIQNLWFRLEIAISSGTKERFGPYFPSEQSLSLKDSHYYLEHEIPIEGLSVLSPPKALESIFPEDVTFSLNYYIRDKTVDDSSIFFLFADTLSLTDIIKRSKGHQKSRERFVVERQLELGVIFLTLHFLVKEEINPPPQYTEPLSTISSGCWLLERVSIAMKC